MANNYINLPVEGSGGAGVSSLNTLTGAVTLSEGAGITLTPVGNDIEISASSGGGDVVGPASSQDHDIALFDGITGKLIKEANFNLLSADGEVSLSVDNRSASDSTGQASIDWNGRALTDINGAAILVWTDGSVGINQELPDGSAVLDVGSSTKGFLPPRMQTAERDAIATPATGLFIYNISDENYNFFGETEWKQVGNVVGPATVQDFDIPLFDGTTGKLLKGANFELPDSSGWGSVLVNSRELVDDNGSTTVFWKDRLLVDFGNVNVLDWEGKTLTDGGATNALNWDTRELINSANDVVADWSNADAAALKVVSTTAGFLPPVMTTTEKNAISSPIAGLMVYDSTLNRPCFYDGTNWVTL